VTTLLVYSDDETVREQVRTAIGGSPAAGVSKVDYLMASDGEQVVRAADQRLADLLILDGEAWPTGGLGLSRQLKNEIAECPPIVVLIGRRDDRWLAKWCQADAVLPLPLDAVALTRTVVSLLTGEGPGPGALTLKVSVAPPPRDRSTSESAIDDRSASESAINTTEGAVTVPDLPAPDVAAERELQ
jgi:DNA-binding response OmpR family regulator